MAFEHTTDAVPHLQVSALVVLGNELVRHGVLSMLRGVRCVSDTWACGSPSEAMAVLMARRPEILLCHAEAPGAGSLVAATAELGTRTLLLLDDVDLTTADAVAVAAADGFLLQDELTVGALASAVERLGSGEVPLPGRLARMLVAGLGTAPTHRPARGVSLTPREQQVLGLLAQGLRNKQIARQLAISEHGVKRHVTNVLAKLNSPNRTLAVALALREGLVLPVPAGPVPAGRGPMGRGIPGGVGGMRGARP